MEVVKGKDDASNIEPGGVVSEALTVSEDCPELPTQAGLHQHVEVPGVLEGLKQLDYEWTWTVFHYKLFIQDVLPLLCVFDLKQR